MKKSTMFQSMFPSVLSREEVATVSELIGYSSPYTLYWNIGRKPLSNKSPKIRL